MAPWPILMGAHPVPTNNTIPPPKESELDHLPKALQDFYRLQRTVLPLRTTRGASPNSTRARSIKIKHRYAEGA